MKLARFKRFGLRKHKQKRTDNLAGLTRYKKGRSSEGYIVSQFPDSRLCRTRKAIKPGKYLVWRRKEDTSEKDRHVVGALNLP